MMPQVPEPLAAKPPLGGEALLYLQFSEYPWRQRFTLAINGAVIARNPEANAVLRVYAVPGTLRIRMRFLDTDGESPVWVEDSLIMEPRGGETYRFVVNFKITPSPAGSFERSEYRARTTRTLRLCGDNDRVCED